MIGQKKLISKIDSYNFSTLPNSIMLIGDLGSEKEEVCEYISQRFNLPMYDITELISNEYLNDIYSIPNPGLYIIDGSKISEREQNIILKFYEEPTDYIHIILTCENRYNILETIQNRSYILVMDSYTREELEPLCNLGTKELILKIANTPGTVEELNSVDLTGLEKLCKTILDSLSRANYQNTLTIANKINFKDEYDKYPLWAFNRMLSKVILDYLEEEKIKNSSLYWYVNNFSRTYEPLLDKKRYFENLLTNMWLEVHHGH